MKILSCLSVASPVGTLTCFCDSTSIIRLLLPADNAGTAVREMEKHFQTRVDLCPPNEIAARAAEELDAYFSKRRRTFSVPVTFISGSSFTRAVWRAIPAIPYGQTVSYAELARRAGVSGTRAVGNAVGNNPLPILIPCHRVIRKNGTMGGYSGGPEIKRLLLELEGASGFST